MTTGSRARCTARSASCAASSSARRCEIPPRARKVCGGSRVRRADRARPEPRVAARAGRSRGTTRSSARRLWRPRAGPWCFFRFRTFVSWETRRLAGRPQEARPPAARIPVGRRPLRQSTSTGGSRAAENLRQFRKLHARRARRSMMTQRTGAGNRLTTAWHASCIVRDVLHRMRVAHTGALLQHGFPRTQIHAEVRISYILVQHSLHAECDAKR